MESCAKLRHPYMIQVGLIIVEVYSSGGKMHEVLNSSVVLFNGLEQYSEEKQSELRPYTELVYISILIFLVIALIITSQFIAPAQQITDRSPTKLRGRQKPLQPQSQDSPVVFRVGVFFRRSVRISISGE